MIERPTYRFTFSTDHRGNAWVHAHDAPDPQARQYYINDGDLAWLSSWQFGDTSFDFVDIALAAYVADRLSPRNRHGLRSPPSWSRHIQLQIPVREPDRWNAAALHGALTESLGYLTDDEWHFTFVRKTTCDRRAEMAPRLFSLPTDSTSVALFSGGLDSLAGFCRAKVSNPAARYLLISGVTNDRLGAVQQRLIAALRRRTDWHLEPLSIPLGFLHRTWRFDREEHSQRSRAFLFTVLGALAALGANMNRLVVFENGIGAINLPYVAGQIGTHMARASHPRAVAAISDLVSRVAHQPFTIELPWLFETKAQLCEAVRDSDLGDLAVETVSCDGYPQYVVGQSQCGCCTACILRRQALHAAGLSSLDASIRYRFDILGNLDRLPERQLEPLRLMAWQVSQLQHLLDAPSPWRSLASAYPDILDVLPGIAPGGDVERVQARLIALYRRYCAEWSTFPAWPPGWSSRVAA